MSAKFLAAALLVALTACSDNDEEFEQEIRDICGSLQVGTTTLREGSNAFGDTPVLIECREDFAPLAGQTCATGVSLCQLRWQFLSNKCGPGGCTLVCEVRTEGTPATLETTICARRFLDEQPFVIE